MAAKKPESIPLPEDVQRMIKQLLRDGETINRSLRAKQAEIDAVIVTARACLGVPDGYVIDALDVGFVPDSQLQESA